MWCCSSAVAPCPPNLQLKSPFGVSCLKFRSFESHPRNRGQIVWSSIQQDCITSHCFKAHIKPLEVKVFQVIVFQSEEWNKGNWILPKLLKMAVNLLVLQICKEHAPKSFMESADFRENFQYCFPKKDPMEATEHRRWIRQINYEKRFLQIFRLSMSLRSQK